MAAALNKEMFDLGMAPNAIRAMFEYGIDRAEEIGAENIFNYSIGNPSIEPPEEFNQAIIDLMNNMDALELHGYSLTPGDKGFRQAIAENLTRRFGIRADRNNVFITCGCTAALTICIKALTSKPEDEFIAFVPYFPEYRVFVETMGGTFVECEPDEKEFQINFDALERILNPNTKALIINTPNNPTGTVLREDVVKRLVDLLHRKEQEYGHAIYIISDEPYREVVYDDIKVPFFPNLYENTFVCYSFSKTLSIPGDRIGYIFVPDEIEDKYDTYKTLVGTGRALSFVCAPMFLQQICAKCLDVTSDIEVYRKNRDLLYGALIEYGFDVIHPDGAFYLWMKAPGGDADAFVELAKKYELLLVTGATFGDSKYVRLAYCVDEDMIRRSLPAFKKLAEECHLK
ncbi:MAG: pyridoxal phosphate-dependent aminotransferase [Lachnospiraceae bacterium]|nr:pyridoxal phosphate-dependent aminotransferase [Lachnospiraceae bacterium]